MIDAKIFDMLYSYLEERSDNTVCSQLNADPEYQNALEEECKLYQQYENLNLSEEQCKVIEKWVDAMLLFPVDAIDGFEVIDIKIGDISKLISL